MHFARGGLLLAAHALASALLLSACHAPGSAAARSEPTAVGSATATPRVAETSEPAARFPAGECARLLGALAHVKELVEAGDLNAATPEARLEVAMHQSERLSDELERVRDTLRSPELAVEANHVLLASAYLQHETAELFALKHRGETNLSVLEHSLYVAARQEELAFDTARARCEDDASRPQSSAWTQAAMQSIDAAKPQLLACFPSADQNPANESARGLSIQVRVLASGAVAYAGPVDLTLTNGASAELAYCIVRVLERTRFPAPRGEAVLALPFPAFGRAESPH